MDLSQLDNRGRILLSGLNLNGLGLEIGPSHNPVARKALGFRVEILDHLDQQGLRDKYAVHAGINIDRIEYVDHVWNGEPYHKLTGEGRFDWIVASHVIEHMPDMIGFIRDCERVLTPDGVLSLALPDRRYCFDQYRPVSGIGRVIDAHLNNRSAPSAGDVAEHVIFASSVGGRAAWETNFRGESQWLHDAGHARRLLEEMRAGPAYHDVHVWVQTPATFRLLMADLFALGLINVRETAVIDGGHEFFMQMSAAGAGPSVDRMALARAAAEEATVNKGRA